MRRTATETAEIKARLAEIEAANGGVLTPNAVVEDAKHEDSPLHRHFEWDVKRAAESYWIGQARELITSVRIETRTQTRTFCVPYYVHDPRVESNQQGYVSVRQLKSDKDLAKDALLEEFKRVESALVRTRDLASVLGLEKDLDKVAKSIALILSKIQKK